MWTEMMPVMEQMLTLFLMLALGWVAGRTGVLSLESDKHLAKLVNCITNPCNILYSALCSQRMLTNGEVFQLLGLYVLLFALLIALAQLVPGLLRVPREQRGQYKFMMIFSNVGYMGIPVVAAIFGQEAVFCVSLFIMVFYVFVYTYGIWLIRGGEGGFSLRRLLSPMMVSSVAGLVLYLCHARVGGVLESTLDSVRRVTTPCAMMVVGCALSSVPLRQVFSNFRLYLVAVLKLAAVPLLVYLLFRPLLPNRMMLGVLVTIAAMPIASNFTILSAQYDRDQKLASEAVFITTLLSVLTIPILAALLRLG